MKKAELVTALAEGTKLLKTQASSILDTLGDIIAAELLAGGEITLPSVGKLSVKNTSARTGHNPRTGETIQIAAGKKVSFTVTKNLKEALR